MLTVSFQRKIYDAYNKGRTLTNGNYEYCIRYNPMAATHTWIVRRFFADKEWVWVQPLDESIY